ncbi:MAG TPA: ATP-binding cassette domain-containing protein, partial [Caldimonas sp.]|nr:ATP-binding cassette domain-containing protein [Caldimonas sp.]
MSAVIGSGGRSAGVRVEGVTKLYPVRTGDDVLALDRVDLDIAPGSFVAVVGPSGCGKSTLLSLLAGLVPLSAGRLLIDG